MANGRANHDQLVRALRRNEPVPPEVRKWYLDGVRRWRKSSASLESALGIVRDRDAIALRDASLQAAAALMPEDWKGRERVRQVQRAARTLATFTDADAIDWDRRPRWHEQIWLALQSAPLPGSRRLFDLCNFRASCTKTAAP